MDPYIEQADLNPASAANLHFMIYFGELEVREWYVQIGIQGLKLIISHIIY